MTGSLNGFHDHKKILVIDEYEFGLAMVELKGHCSSIETDIDSVENCFGHRYC
jgi:hypothetical protein